MGTGVVPSGRWPVLSVLEIDNAVLARERDRLSYLWS